ncbi:MAG: CDP-archaeol synthase [Verrucomicrobiales bacterium]|nr:CDP-archaeol synthase [Verrucomicrobiales bacterium]
MPDHSNIGTKNNRSKVFRSRSISTIFLWALIASAVYFDRPIIFSSIIILIGSLGVYEFFGLLGLRATPAFQSIRISTLILSFLYLSMMAYFLSAGCDIGIIYIDSASIALVVIVLTVLLLFYPIDGTNTKDLFFSSLFGFIYVPLLISFLLRILYLNYDSFEGQGGEYYIIYLLVVTKFSDMGAYLIGTLIGKHKMISHISPGKTWEGFIFGCLTFAVGGGCLMFYLFKDEMPLLGWQSVVILSFVLAFIAALGDLAESVLKRSLAVKDSGNILPGIGGVLDLVDSVLFTAPVLFIYLTYLS